MEEKLLVKYKTAIIIIVGIVISIALFLLLSNNNIQKNYINGNILNLPLYQIEQEEPFKFISPFKEQRSNSMFMYRSLFLPDNTLVNIEPDLAESCDISKDGKTYTITLKENNYWSDGKKVTPVDVIFTIKAVLKSTDINYLYENVMQYIEGATEYKNGEADEISGISYKGNVITINLTVLYNTFLPVLSQLVILPNHILKDADLENLHNNNYWQNPISSGMYKIDEFVSEGDDKYFKLVHNEYYTEKKSDIEEVRLHLNHTSKLLDYSATNNTQEMTTYNNASNYKGFNIEMLLYRFFVFNISGVDGNYNEAMDNVSFRQAVMAAIDREKILSNVYLGLGEIVNSGIPNDNDFNNGFVHKYDPKNAKTLLKESGYDLDRTFKIAYYNDNSQNMKVLSNVAQNLEEIGMTVEIVYTPTEKERYVDRDYDMLFYDYTAFNENAWYGEYDKSNILSTNLFSLDTEFDGLFAELRESANDKIRAEYFDVLQKLEQEFLYILPMFSLNQMVYINNNRVSLPSDIAFGNSWFRYDIDLEEWKIKKE